MSVEITIISVDAGRAYNDNGSSFTLSSISSRAGDHRIVGVGLAPTPTCFVPDAPFVVASGTANSTF